MAYSTPASSASGAQLAVVGWPAGAMAVLCSTHSATMARDGTPPTTSRSCTCTSLVPASVNHRFTPQISRGLSSVKVCARGSYSCTVTLLTVRSSRVPWPVNTASARLPPWPVKTMFLLPAGTPGGMVKLPRRPCASATKEPLGRGWAATAMPSKVIPARVSPGGKSKSKTMSIWRRCSSWLVASLRRISAAAVTAWVGVRRCTRGLAQRVSTSVQ